MNDEKIVTTRVSQEKYDMIKSICEKKNLNVTQVLRQVIDEDMSLETFYLKVHNE